MKRRFAGRINADNIRSWDELYSSRSSTGRLVRGTGNTVRFTADLSDYDMIYLLVLGDGGVFPGWGIGAIPRNRIGSSNSFTPSRYAYIVCGFGGGGDARPGIYGRGTSWTVRSADNNTDFYLRQIWGVKN